MKQANGLMSEVTPFVNAGRSLPRAGLDIPPEARAERYVSSSSAARDSAVLVLMQLYACRHVPVGLQPPS